MDILFELAKSHPTLPAGEAIACLEAERLPSKVQTATSDVVVACGVPAKAVPVLASRLSQTSVLDRFLFSCAPAELAACAARTSLGEGSLAIRIKNRSSRPSQDYIDELAAVYEGLHPIDLSSPDIELRVLATDDTVFVGTKLAEISTSQFEARKAQFRPFSSPVTMHPRLARALVNLARVRAGETMLDPFCGTGGILIEAGLLGVRVVGGDVEQKMVDGCKASLAHYGIMDAELFPTDIGHLAGYAPQVDGVATDFPYGRSTTTKGEALQRLYSRSFATIAEVLSPGRTAVVGLADRRWVSLGEEVLTLQTVYECRVHKSLTRYFAVFLA